MTKIFGIGLQRTGTTSLYHAGKLLGLRAAPNAIDLFYDLHAPIIDQYDLFTDNPIPHLYQQIDQLYPNSKFILTTRPVDDWLASVEWLFTQEIPTLPDHLQQIGSQIHTAFYGRDTFDETIFREEWHSYHDEAQTYFSSRPEDLLIIDLAQEKRPWSIISPFLGLPEPNTPFPHSNSRHTKTPSFLTRLKRLKRRFK